MQFVDGSQNLLPSMSLLELRCVSASAKRAALNGCQRLLRFPAPAWWAAARALNNCWCICIAPLRTTAAL
eukprot:10310458-Alexandrium_andersonii.AAC.1